VLELEYTLIPHGLHVVGSAPSAAQRVDLLHVAGRGIARPAARPRGVQALVAGQSPALAAAAGLARTPRPPAASCSNWPANR
jgi:magnesium chelatase subunit H